MLSINISELIWTIVNFFLLLFLLRRFLYEPICRHMDARQARIDEKLALEREAQAALDAEERRREEQEQSVREESRALLRQTSAQAARESAQTVRDARQDMKSAREQERERLLQESRREEEQIAGAEPALAAALAGRLLREEAEL